MRYVNLVLIFGAVTLLMRYLTQSSKKKAENNNGVMVLRMNKVYGVFGYISILASIFVGVIASLGTVKNITDLVLALGLFIFLFGIGLLLVLPCRNQKIEVTREYITYYSMIGKITEIHWSEISDVSFNKVALQLKLTAGKKNIRLHLHLVGFYDFIKLLEEKLNDGLYMEALMKLEEADKNIMKRNNL